MLRAAASASLFLSGGDGFGFASGALRNLGRDYGAAFQVEHRAEPDRHTTLISRCLYRDVFDAEGASELTRCACCTADTAMLEVLSPASHRASFSRPRSMAAGDACCELRVERTDASGAALAASGSSGGQEREGSGRAAGGEGER